MEISIRKKSGLALLVGAVLVIGTIALHPTGGEIKHLLAAANIIIVSHAIAILAIPLLAIGFWGITSKLGTNAFFSILAFCTMMLGLIAGMIAAAINGLALPIYILNHRESFLENEIFIYNIIRYNTAINQAFDYIFIGAISLAILLYSIAILQSKKFPIWIGYYGLSLMVIVALITVVGLSIVSLHGFSLFMIAIVIWILSMAISLYREDFATNGKSRKN